MDWLLKIIINTIDFLYRGRDPYLVTFAIILVLTGVIGFLVKAYN